MPPVVREGADDIDFIHYGYESLLVDFERKPNTGKGAKIDW